MTPENGSTEVWLGTHLNTGIHVQEGSQGERASGRIKTEALEERRQVRRPCQPVVPKGAIVVRDLRLWHAGVGNRTEDIRVMLAMSKFGCLCVCDRELMGILVHFAPWYRNPMKLELADDIQDVLEGDKNLEVPVNWVSREEALGRYLNRGFGNAYDFSQGP